MSYFPDTFKINVSKYYTSGYRHKTSILEKILVLKNYLLGKILIYRLFKNKQISVLDVGCGNGDYLNQLSKSYTKTGIDIKIDNQESCLIEGDFLTHQFNQKYDLITFNHSLEHLLNPKKAIQKAQSLLKNNGVVTISLPVSDSYSFKINPTKAFHLDPPRHIFIPNTDKFKNILSTYFSNLTVMSTPFEFPLDLYWTLKNSHKKYLLPLFPLLKIIKPETKLFICKKN